MSLQKTVSDLRSLKIQGASKVKYAVISELKQLIEKDRSRSEKEFLKKLKKAAYMLAYARPTEPKARNAVRKVLLHSIEGNSLDVLKNAMVKECNSILSEDKKIMQKIAANGAKLFKKDYVAFTHCHSHSVEAIFVKAFLQKKLSHVIVTETRPRFQGRITAENLARKGIPVTLIVDSAAHLFLQKTDLFFSGADAILANGSVVNKIGTRMVSDYAKQYGVPHYVASSSDSFDPETFFGKDEVIEERSAKEVWNKKLRNLRIVNHAFDLTPAKNIKGIVSEYGVHSPKKFSKLIIKKSGLRKRFISLQELLKE